MTVLNWLSVLSSFYVHFQPISVHRRLVNVNSKISPTDHELEKSQTWRTLLPSKWSCAVTVVLYVFIFFILHSRSLSLLAVDALTDLNSRVCNVLPFLVTFAATCFVPDCVVNFRKGMGQCCHVRKITADL